MLLGLEREARKRCNVLQRATTDEAMVYSAAEAGYAPGPLRRAYLVPARQAPRPASSPRGGAHLYLES
jgi:hypothetical protein